MQCHFAVIPMTHEAHYWYVYILCLGYIVCLTSAKCGYFIWAPIGQVFVLHFMPSFLDNSKQKEEIGVQWVVVILHRGISGFTSPSSFMLGSDVDFFITLNLFFTQSLQV